MNKIEKKKVIDKKKNNKKIIKIALFFVFLVIGIYAIIGAIKLMKKPTSNFVVEQSKISKEEFVDAIVIRDEELITQENGSEKTVKVRQEGEKVAKGEAIYRYVSAMDEQISSQIQNIDKEIQDIIKNTDETINSSEIKTINSQIEKQVEELYQCNDLQKGNQCFEEISGKLNNKIEIRAELTNNTALKDLIKQRNEYVRQLEEASKYVNAERSGVISYRLDGLEDRFKADDFSNLTYDIITDSSIKSGQIISISSSAGKIINNFQANLACVSSSEEARNSKVGDLLKISIQGNSEIDAKIVYKKEEAKDKIILVFEVNKSVAELTKYRKVSIDVIWWSNSGLKVPNSAIQYEGNFAYVTRNRAGLKEKILVKILSTNDRYSIVENYTYYELQEAGYNTESLNNKKSISVYDEIEVAE